MKFSTTKFWTHLLCTSLCILSCSTSTIAANYYGHEVNDGLTESTSSKRLLRLFESPLSTSVLTRNDIERSGATSIPEALRLVPGLIVRELTNGQYDVHIRGMDNAPIAQTISESTNRNTLVVIDGRIVFEYFLGGTFWDSLPVNISDVEKIEVVRGAVSSLYGPNALTGVINISTIRPKETQGIAAEVNLRAGNHQTQIAQMSVSDASHEIKWRLSAFDDSRERYTGEYYSYNQQEYVSLQSLPLPSSSERFPKPKSARDNRAVSFSLNNDPANALAYDIFLNHQDSAGHKTYLGGGQTSFTYGETKSDVINIKANYLNLFSNVSYHRGDQKTAGQPQFDYEYDITQSTLEYQYRRPQWIIRPGLRYDEMQYDGSFIGGERTLRNLSYMLRSEYAPERDTNIVLAMSADQYNNPSDTYLAYQIAAAHKLNPDTLIRGGVQKSNRSSFLQNSYLDVDATLPNDPLQRRLFKGNPEADLVTIQTYELGLRQQISLFQWIDFELFYSETDDHSESIQKPSFPDGNQTVTPTLLERIPTRVEQLGLTVDWNYEGANWDINYFITLQETRTIDQIQDTVEPLQLSTINAKSTPDYYGGINYNWDPTNEWRFNSTVYFMDAYETIIRVPGLTHKTKFLALLNLTAHRMLAEDISASISLRNLANRKASQFYFTDEIEPSLVFGLKAGF